MFFQMLVSGKLKAMREPILFFIIIDHFFNESPIVLFGRFIQKLWAFPYLLRSKKGPAKMLMHDSMQKELPNIT